MSSDKRNSENYHRINIVHKRAQSNYMFKTAYNIYVVSKV